MERYLQDANVGRPCPDSVTLNRAFGMEVKRKQRRSDGTFTLNGCRFEVPSQYRHFDTLHVRYARWDLSQAILIDPISNLCLATLYPLDKSANASALRRPLTPPNTIAGEIPQTGVAPLLKKLMSDYAATGLPPAYLPKQTKKGEKS